MADVTLEHLNKTYPGNVVAVRDANLHIKDQEFMVFVGPSGCGKTTTLRCIAGLEEITAGTVRIGDRVVNDVPPKDRDIAMVFQNYALYPHMTVFDNMAFSLKLRKVRRAEIKERVTAAATLLGIETLLNRKPKALSGGQRQRVALGRAIVRQPAVFLFDEPLSNLDAKMRVQTRTEIKKLHHRLQATMIYVTHDQVEAMTMGDRITVMNHAEIQQVDAPLDLYNKPANQFVAGFIGSPPMNFFRGRLEARADALHFVEPTFDVRLDNAGLPNLPTSHAGRDIVFGIRPENVHPAPADQAHLTATVEVVEPMGAEVFLYLTTGSNDFIARVDAGVHPTIGTSIAVRLDLAKVHLFDADSGENLVL